jgi:diguanylate cyclase (GGDEF)-like protein
VDVLSATSILFSSTVTSACILVLAVLIRPGLDQDRAALAWWAAGDLGKIASRIPPLLQCALLTSGCDGLSGLYPARVFIPICLCLSLGLALQVKALACLCHVPIGAGRTIALVAGCPLAAATAVALLPSLRPLLVASSADVLVALQIAMIWRDWPKSRALTIMAVSDAVMILLGGLLLARTASGVPVPDLPPLQALIPDFISSITGTFMMLMALGERERAYIRRMATIDQLTGALNRSGFIPVLDLAWRRASRHRGPMSLAILDIDHFKRLNDDFGHAAGDTVLAAFAAARRKLCRDRDVVARWGGEEFLLLMPDTPVQSAVDALKRIRAALPAQLAGCAPCPVTFSAGVYECGDFSDAESIDVLVARADHCLYTAKVKRDCIVSEPPETDPYDTRPHLAELGRQPSANRSPVTSASVPLP